MVSAAEDGGRVERRDRSLSRIIGQHHGAERQLAYQR
jgi:hypothetical protein